MIWPFSLIAENRNLGEMLQSEHSRAVLLEDRLDSALTDRTKLWEMLQAALSGERDALRMQVNAAWQQKGFGVPYPEAPSLPAAAVPETGGGSVGRQAEMPSARVARETNSFIKSMLSNSQ